MDDLALVLDPLALLGILDVHVLDAHCAAVGVPQHPKDLAQREEGRPTKTAGRELAVEVPEGEAVLGDVEVGVTTLAVLERVGVGHEVAADAVGVDEFLDPSDLVDVVVVSRRDVLDPAHRLVGDPQRGEDLVVEAFGAEQQLVDDPQEIAALSTLDDAVVIGRRQRERLAHRVAVEGLDRGAGPFGGVFHRTDTDDRALALHEAGDGVHGADGAGVRQGDRRAGEVFDGELAVAGLFHHVFVCRPEVDEVHRLGRLH